MKREDLNDIRRSPEDDISLWRNTKMDLKRINAALNVMRRMPPSQIELHLSSLINLMPDLTDDLLQRVDQPLQTAKDKDNGRMYLLCDYNRDADSYR